MKWMYLLPLLLTAVSCEKKLNPRAIGSRGDHHLRYESRDKKSPTSEQLRADESKYSAKAEVAQQYYAPTAATAAAATVAPQELGNQVGDYAELQSYESFKYASGNHQSDYSQENDDPSAYLQQSPLVTSAAEQQQQQQQQQQQHTPQQYYIQEGRSHSQNGYDAQQQQLQQQQQQLYQQEVLVGNQLQSVQQKAAAQKYTDGSDDKGIYYINIPMSQLLAYYQNYGIVQSKSKNAEQQLPIPVYTPTLTQNQVYAPAKVTYQPKLQYVSSYPKHAPAVIAKSSSPTTILHAAQAATAAAPVHQIPATSHQQYTGPAEVLAGPTYTSAYQPQRYQYQYVMEQQQQPQQYAHQYQHQPQLQQQPQHRQQMQQQQQIVYENTPNSYQPDTYSEPPTAQEQDNYLYDQQQYQPQTKQQQYYVNSAIAQQLMSQLLQQTNLHNSIEAPQPHGVKQEPAEPLHTDFTPPQYQAQKFHASQEITHLMPVSNEHEGFPSTSSYSSASSYSSQPKSLLDTYVPSRVIAAQDSHRYRERPIKLESGFLPSKINFIGYKKRKTE